MSSTLTPATRYAWLVRREVWEHRVAVWAPAALGLLVIGSALASFLNPQHTLMEIDGQDLNHVLTGPMAGNVPIFVAGALTAMTIAFLVLANLLQCYYSADALYSERSQRAILFWKSLPISDRDAVLSKLLVATAVIPLAAWLAALVTEIFLVALLTIQFRGVPAVSSALVDPAVWWHATRLSLYVLVTGAVWFLPVVAWLLLVSAAMPVARGMRLGRSPLLGAILIPVAAGIVEKLVFNTHHLARVVVDRVSFRGFPAAALSEPHGLAIRSDDPTQHVYVLADVAGGLMAPLQFVTTPSVIAGVAVAAVMVGGAIYFRRRSESRG